MHYLNNIVGQEALRGEEEGGQRPPSDECYTDLLDKIIPRFAYVKQTLDKIIPWFYNVQQMCRTRSYLGLPLLYRPVGHIHSQVCLSYTDPQDIFNLRFALVIYTCRTPSLLGWPLLYRPVGHIHLQVCLNYTFMYIGHNHTKI